MSRQSDLDNHSNQCNPNNDEYWHSRGDDERPDDWRVCKILCKRPINSRRKPACP